MSNVDVLLSALCLNIEAINQKYHWLLLGARDKETITTLKEACEAAAANAKELLNAWEKPLEEVEEVEFSSRDTDMHDVGQALQAARDAAAQKQGDA